MDNLVDIYYKKIMESTDKAFELMSFYCEVFEKEVNSEDIKMFRELIPLFGVKRIFLAIINIKLYYESIKERHLGKYLKSELQRNVKYEYDRGRTSFVPEAANESLKEERDRYFNKGEFNFREIQ